MGSAASRNESRVFPAARRDLSAKDQLRLLRASKTVIWEPPRHPLSRSASQSRLPPPELWLSSPRYDDSGWSMLPAELLVMIFQCLATDDVRHAAQVCRRWSPIAWSCQSAVDAGRFLQCFRDAHLHGLARMAGRLTTLDLRGCHRITLDGLQSIGQLMALRSLTLPLPRFPANSQDYPIFSPLPNLSHMEICEV
eukprot:TRINITY_DN8258_c0_g1_i1.p2 TRINITY_DN8258_c0_g1~~TRINITY_DN8258_c0_g1_i1.p2  ORF type:complete len:195 (-),score=41.74 TRINITY_DN8258_c0_g1_i1:209-793(-)